MMLFSSLKIAGLASLMFASPSLCMEKRELNLRGEAKTHVGYGGYLNVTHSAKAILLAKKNLKKRKTDLPTVSAESQKDKSKALTQRLLTSATQDTRPLPAGWTKVKDPQTGGIYYQHKSGRPTQWNHPADKLPEGWVAYYQDGKICYYNEATKTSQYDLPELVMEPEFVMQLFDGWSQYKDVHTGQLFYYDEQSGEKTWERPIKVKRVVLCAVEESDEEQKPVRSLKFSDNVPGNGFCGKILFHEKGQVESKETEIFISENGVLSYDSRNYRNRIQTKFFDLDSVESIECKDFDHASDPTYTFRIARFKKEADELVLSKKIKLKITLPKVEALKGFHEKNVKTIAGKFYALVMRSIYDRRTDVAAWPFREGSELDRYFSL